MFFQNRRAKEKRLKKDAGRARWGQYFRTGLKSSSPVQGSAGGGGGNGGERGRDSDRDSELELDYNNRKFFPRSRLHVNNQWILCTADNRLLTLILMCITVSSTWTEEVQSLKSSKGRASTIKLFEFNLLISMNI